MVKSVSQLNQSERERYDWRDAELRKMRRIATALLLMMAVLFVVGHQLERQLHPHWAFLTAFAEAGMVGGLADWFAVTALFRYPLGIPIPHTAIIPNNKEAIQTMYMPPPFPTTNAIHQLTVMSVLSRNRRVISRFPESFGLRT